MITILLEKIITILEGWIQSFTSHAQHVEDKLDSLDQTASDIETNTEPISDIADNTGAVVTPIQNIKSNTDSIKQSSQTSANNTTAILNNISTLSTNTGRAAAFAENCANNTLEIKDKITTIASDTTQLRADSANIAADVSSINQAIGYYVANTLVTEESEGSLCSFDTDLKDYLQKAVVSIPADLTGFSGITLTKNGKNLLPNLQGLRTTYSVFIGQTDSSTYPTKLFPNINYHLSFEAIGTNVQGYFLDSNGNQSSIPLSGNFTVSEEKNVQMWIYSSTLDNTSVKNFQLEIGSGSSYEPYKAMTYPVSFGSTITDGAEVDLLSGIVKINTSPVTYSSITPIAIRTYKGVNNIYSDIGTSALTYRETLKHYLDKNNQ